MGKSCDNCGYSNYDAKVLEKEQLILHCALCDEVKEPSDICDNYIYIDQAINYERTFEYQIKEEQKRVRSATWGDNPFAYSSTEALMGANSRYAEALFKSVVPKLSAKYDEELLVEAIKAATQGISYEDYGVQMLVAENDRLAEKLISLSEIMGTNAMTMAVKTKDSTMPERVHRCITAILDRRPKPEKSGRKGKK